MKILIAILLSLFGSFAFSQTQPMNILVILTDDQRWDTVDSMPNLTSLSQQGVVFDNAIQPTPLCAPSRSILLSGGFHSQDTGVLGNTEPNGGLNHFNDTMNIGVMLQAAGYETFYTGKWINGYESLTNYVPPGWNHWFGRKTTAVVQDWYHFKYIVGSSNSSPNNNGVLTNANAYTTYYERDLVLSRINAAAATPTKPFFIMWASSASHPKAQPANEDVNLFPQYQYTGRGVSETDLSDKPSWVRGHKALTGDGPGYGPEFVRNQLRSLQGVDRSVKAIIDQLKANGQYNNTLIIYTSDNGYQWGEHNLWFKSKPYQEDMRVPFIVFAPGVAHRVDHSLISPSLDLGATLFEVAGINKMTQGSSIMPLLRDPSASWRTSMFFEEMDNFPNNGNSIYAGMVTLTNQYTLYWTGEEELYDMIADPFQLQSRHNDPSLASLKQSLRTQMTGQLGLAMIPLSNKTAPHGKPFNLPNQPWGGFAPFTWTIENGKLPPGLVMDSGTGLIHGIPTTVGKYTFTLRVTDSSLSPQTGKPHTFVGHLNMVTVT